MSRKKKAEKSAEAEAEEQKAAEAEAEEQEPVSDEFADALADYRRNQKALREAESETSE